MAAEKREKGWGTHAFSACAARLSDFLLCLSCRECPIRPYGAPSPRGEGSVWDSGILVSQSSPRGEGSVSGIAAFSYRSLPHWGRGTASAEDRGLSYIAYLRRFPSLSFIPLEPYPARFARHLPHAGKALSVVILFPHMHVFALTMRENRYPRIVAFPIGEGGPRQRWIGCSRKRRT